MAALLGALYVFVLVEMGRECKVGKGCEAGAGAETSVWTEWTV